MDAFRSVMRCSLLFIILAILVRPAQAQSTLIPLTPANGSLSEGESQSWTFQAAEGEALSFVVESTSGNLDPLLIITNSNGTEIIRNDDYNYPDSGDSLLEAITMSRTGTYTATVTAFGSTSGDYELTLLTGFAELAADDSFDDQDQWESTGAPLTLAIENGEAALSVNIPQERGIVLLADNTLSDAFTQVQVVSVQGQPSWVVGMVTRYQDERNYYVFSINQQGQWRFAVNTNGNENVLRNWVSHPAIVPGNVNFQISLMANAMGFDFFYNGVLIGRAVDNTITEAGQVGVMIETGSSSINSEVNARFDNLTVTTPIRINNQSVIPERIIVTDSRSIVPQLQRRHLVPAIGQMILTVPESFATYNRPGVYNVPLAGGQTFRNFAIGTTVIWTTDISGPAGCGLTIHATGDTDYTLAYLDQIGEYGLSRRTDDTFSSGIYGENRALNASGSHHLLVIAREEILYYYVDGLFAGQLNNTPAEGTIGNAVVNFEPINTSCQFTDTWVWSWD